MEEEEACLVCDTTQNLYTTLCCYSNIKHCPDHICHTCCRCSAHCHCVEFKESYAVKCPCCDAITLSGTISYCRTCEAPEEGCPQCLTHCQNHIKVCAGCSTECTECGLMSCEACMCTHPDCQKCSAHRAPCCTNCYNHCTCPFDKEIIQSELEKTTHHYHTPGGYIKTVEPDGITRLTSYTDRHRLLVPFVVKNVALRKGLMEVITKLQKVILAPSLNIHSLREAQLLSPRTVLFNLTSAQKTLYFNQMSGELLNLNKCVIGTITTDDPQEKTPVHWFPNWVDFKGITIDSLLTILRSFNSILNNPYIDTIVVHCTAGCGRTGTLVAASIIHQLVIINPKLIETPNLVRTVKYFLRIWRPWAIQGEEQFALLKQFKKFLVSKF